MKNFFMAAAVALAAVAAPAFAADFTGPRVGANVGIAGDDVFSDDLTTYGVNVGYDIALTDGVIGGVTVEYGDSNKTGRDLSATARVGVKVLDRALVYGLAGYTNLGAENVNVRFDGYRVGGGLEVAVAGPVYATAEYRYSNYEGGFDGHTTLVGVGFRF